MKTIIKFLFLITILTALKPLIIRNSPKPRKLVLWDDAATHRLAEDKEDFKREFVNKIMGTMKKKQKMKDFHHMETKSLKSLGYLFERASNKLESVSGDILSGLDNLNHLAEEDIN